MKTHVSALIGTVLLAIAYPGWAAKESSKLSEFKGRYTGTIFLNASGSPISGTTTGRISAAKTKENGTIALTSVINSSGTSASWNETYGLHKRALSYSLFISPSTFAPGSGTVHVGKTSITYSGTFTTGGSTFAFSGTMKKTKRGLTITELITGPTTISVTYTLRKQGKD